VAHANCRVADAKGSTEENPESSLVIIMQLTKKKEIFLYHKEKLGEEYCEIEMETVRCTYTSCNFSLV